MRIPALAVPVLAAVSLGGCNDLQLIPITPEITTSALEDGTVGTPYSAQLKAVGGTGPYTWSLESLPAELGWLKVETVESTIGQLGGNPDKHGSFSFRAQVTDSKGRVSSPRSFALTVNACKENEPVPCYYVANEQCYTNSLICTNGDISGTCGNGTLSDDVNHCGAGANGTCGACSSTVADNCQGTCMCGAAAACSGSTSCCSGACTDTQQGDPSNCGSCGHACSPPADSVALCNGGQCDFSCNTGRAKCGTACVPEDMSHCGSSCATCSTNVADNCSGGACKCGSASACSGTSCCGSTCVDTQTNVNHCGSCSNACPTFTAEQLAARNMTGVTCQGGKCTAVCTHDTNNHLRADCDGDLSNGCESDIATRSTCGGCGMNCTLTCCLPNPTPQGYVGVCTDEC